MKQILPNTEAVVFECDLPAGPAAFRQSDGVTAASTVPAPVAVCPSRASDPARPVARASSRPDRRRSTDAVPPDVFGGAALDRLACQPAAATPRTNAPAYRGAPFS